MRTKPRIPGVLAALCAAVVLGLLAGACGGGGTEELASDPADDPGGPIPTAPDGSPRDAADSASTGSVDIDALVERINALTEEDDLCTLLTGQAMASVAGADIDLTGLVANPAGFSALFGALENVFGHMVSIAPQDLTAPLTEMQQVWAGLAGLDLRSATAEQQAGALLGSVATQNANAALGDWVTENCR